MTSLRDLRLRVQTSAKIARLGGNFQFGWRIMPSKRFVSSRRSAPFSCLPHLFEYQAKRAPDAPTILAPGRAPLTYGRLYRHIDTTGRTLRAKGNRPA